MTQHPSAHPKRIVPKPLKYTLNSSCACFYACPLVNPTVLTSTGKPDGQLSGFPETLEGQSDEHPLHVSPLFPCILGRCRVRDIHHLDVSVLNPHSLSHCAVYTASHCASLSSCPSISNRIKPSPDCGPFRNLSTMFQSGRQWAKEMGKNHPSLAWLQWAQTYLVENLLILFLVAGVCL